MMKKITIESEFFIFLFLYLIALFAGIVNAYLGITAFICVTCLVIYILWIRKLEST